MQNLLPVNMKRKVHDLEYWLVRQRMFVGINSTLHVETTAPPSERKALRKHYA